MASRSRSLFSFMKDYGFLRFDSSPGEEEMDELVQIMIRLNRPDLEFKGKVPILYEFRRSRTRSLFVEGFFRKRGKAKVYLFDFYKANYVSYTNEYRVEKVYGEELTEDELKIKVSSLMNFINKIDRENRSYKKEVS